MSTPDERLLRITERFLLPDGRVGVSAWSAADPEQFEQQLRTRRGHGHPEREPARRLHRTGPPLLRIEESCGGELREVDPVTRSRTDPRWRRALARSRRPSWLRLLVGPRELSTTPPPAAVERWVESGPGRS
ncbi:MULTISPECIES: hypothetical protein [unclassified Rathayibacter]|uniref:hypothetical protein n=1 Tax=unclassified Rathayibacter TaxID=2609250 RepID=UPI00188C6281|nr:MULTISPECIES: hypothetical protein [unclassified Rathayibacter]MBF4463211.1 hypothetical protein [Rathayibacter sp. VKM Ac-2879]MBF4504552.1 hypothetical protein [Rathayibacter sp. VKM Ac-2878]